MLVTVTDLITVSTSCALDLDSDFDLELILTLPVVFFLAESSSDTPTEFSFNTPTEFSSDAITGIELDSISSDCPLLLPPRVDSTADLLSVQPWETLLSLPLQTSVLLEIVVLIVLMVVSAEPSLPFKSYLSSPRGEPPGPKTSPPCLRYLVLCSVFKLFTASSSDFVTPLPFPPYSLSFPSALADVNDDVVARGDDFVDDESVSGPEACRERELSVPLLLLLPSLFLLSLLSLFSLLLLTLSLLFSLALSLFLLGLSLSRLLDFFGLRGDMAWPSRGEVLSLEWSFFDGDEESLLDGDFFDFVGDEDFSLLRPEVDESTLTGVVPLIPGIKVIAEGTLVTLLESDGSPLVESAPLLIIMDCGLFLLLRIPNLAFIFGAQGFVGNM